MAFQFVKTWLSIVYPQGPPPIHAHVATMMMLVDLTPMRTIIECLYSVLGRPARVPEKMLRSLLVLLVSAFSDGPLRLYFDDKLGQANAKSSFLSNYLWLLPV